MLYERSAWVNVVQLEVHLAHFLKSGLLHPLLALPPGGERVWAALRCDAADFQRLWAACHSYALLCCRGVL